MSQRLALWVGVLDSLNIIRAMLWLPVMQRRLRRRGLRHCTVRMVQSPVATVEVVSPIAMARAARIAKVVNKLSLLLPWRVSCLDRSLLLVRLLSGAGIPSQLKVGVQSPSTPNTLVAHAWVEVSGKVINDDAEKVRQFQPFPDVGSL